jgi:hypothetical protein
MVKGAAARLILWAIGAALIFYVALIASNELNATKKYI